MKTTRRILLGVSAAALAAVAACGGGGGGSARIDGVWERVDGNAFYDFQNYNVRSIDYLDLTRENTGTLYGPGPAGSVTCTPAIYALSDSAITLDVARLADTRLVSFQRRGSTLTLTDAQGNVSNYTRVDAVPASAQCATLEILSDTALPYAIRDDGLASDGSRLWYLAQDFSVFNSSLWPILPLTSGTDGTVAPVPIYDQFAHPWAMQGSDFWLSCRCGNVSDLERHNPGGTLVDDINSADLGGLAQIFGAAWDGSKLWITASSEEHSAQLRRVDTDAEPDVLEATITFEGVERFEYLTWDGTSFWTILYLGGGRSIARLDPTTGTITATAALPFHSNNGYQGLAAIGGDLYVLSPGYGGVPDTLLRVRVGGAL